MKKLRNKRPPSYDARWLEFVLSKAWETDYHTSHHKAFQLGYLAGLERQKYRDCLLVSNHFYSIPDYKEFDNRRFQAKLIWEDMSSKDVNDKFTWGMK